MKRFSAGAPQRAPRSRPKSKSPKLVRPTCWRCQTKKIVEPGRYSHLRTALPTSERTLKSRSLNDESAVPSPSKSTYWAPSTSQMSAVHWTSPATSVPVPGWNASKSKDSEAESCLYWTYCPDERRGWAKSCSESFGEKVQSRRVSMENDVRSRSAKR